MYEGTSAPTHLPVSPPQPTNCSHEKFALLGALAVTHGWTANPPEKYSQRSPPRGVPGKSCGVRTRLADRPGETSTGLGPRRLWAIAPRTAKCTTLWGFAWVIKESKQLWNSGLKVRPDRQEGTWAPRPKVEKRLTWMGVPASGGDNGYNKIRITKIK